MTAVDHPTAIDDLARRAQQLGWAVERSTVNDRTLLVLHQPGRSVHAWFDHGWFDRGLLFDDWEFEPKLITTVRSTVDGWIAEAAS